MLNTSTHNLDGTEDSSNNVQTISKRVAIPIHNYIILLKSMIISFFAKKKKVMKSKGHKCTLDLNILMWGEKLSFNMGYNFLKDNKNFILFWMKLIHSSMFVEIVKKWYKVLIVAIIYNRSDVSCITMDQVKIVFQYYCYMMVKEMLLFFLIFACLSIWMKNEIIIDLYYQTYKCLA